MRLAVPLLACLLASAAPAQDQPRRQPVTPELDRTAFKDPTARAILERARVARLKQDSTLGAYDANTYFRMSVGMGVRRLGLEKLFFRTEQSARVQWSRRKGIWVQPTGRRTAFPMGDAEIDMAEATPIPYFPGREALWAPGGGLTEVEVDEDDLLHPLADGAEAFYFFATGDSATIRLPDGASVTIRELRITARRPEWRAFVGSFWFDAQRGSLVRAAYRTAVEMDIWQVANEETRRDIEELEVRLRTDSGAKLDTLRERMKDAREERTGMRIIGNILTPMKANISAITVEYGLHEGRFWLPRLNVAEAEFTATMLRIPLRWEERFTYRSVTEDPNPGAIGPVADNDSTSAAFLARTDSGYVAGGGAHFAVGDSKPRTPPSEDSLFRRFTNRADSLRKLADSLRAAPVIPSEARDTARIRELEWRSRYWSGRARSLQRRMDACNRGDSTYYAGSTNRYNGALRLAIRMPCDTSGFETSPDLPASIYKEGETVMGETERDALVKALGWLQPAWSPQRPHIRTGLDLLRYNKIEGLSPGGEMTWTLGSGFAVRAEARIGTADLVPNGELSLTRSNGRSDLSLTAYHRLAVANDDYGAPLSFGASLRNVIDARDEGFYYRTFGMELAGERRAPFGIPFTWQLFAERQRSAGVEPNLRVNFGDLFGNSHFSANIDATQLTAGGLRLETGKSFGVNPARPRFDTRLRLEGAGVIPSGASGYPRQRVLQVGYGRYVADGALSLPLWRYAASISGAAGTSSGDLPVQRAFYIGGLHTVRGQFARLDSGRVGDAFWLGRTEFGFRGSALRPVVFYDVGWAGSRRNLEAIGRPMSGAGMGLSFMDGLLRIDVSRGIWPEQRWRTDFHLGAIF
jgi:hypothetical protein